MWGPCRSMSGAHRALLLSQPLLEPEPLWIVVSVLSLFNHGAIGAVNACIDTWLADTTMSAQALPVLTRAACLRPQTGSRTPAASPPCRSRRIVRRDVAAAVLQERPSRSASNSNSSAHTSSSADTSRVLAQQLEALLPPSLSGRWLASMSGERASAMQLGSACVQCSCSRQRRLASLAPSCPQPPPHVLTLARLTHQKKEVQKFNPLFAPSFHPLLN